MVSHTLVKERTARRRASRFDAHNAIDVDAAQSRLIADLSQLIAQVAASLETEANSQRPETTTAILQASPDLFSAQLCAMKSASRRSQTLAKERRLLAQDMVFSALRDLESSGGADGRQTFLQDLLFWDAGA